MGRRIGVEVAVVLTLLAGCGSNEPSAARDSAGSARSSAPSATASASVTQASSAPAVSVSAAPSAAQPAHVVPSARAGAFPGVEFTEVRAFAMELENQRECEAVLAPDGTVCSSVQGPGVVLTQKQTEKLLEIVREPSTWGMSFKCFEPHHAFVFYDAQKHPVAELTLCFLCQMAASRPALSGVEQSLEFTFFSAGMTDGGMAKLRGLCTELGLPKCTAKDASAFQKR